MKVTKEVLGIPAPARAFDSQYYDQNCPFTGGLLVKKELLTGRVIKKDTNKSATIEWNRQLYIPKYERFALRRSRIRVHNPPCLDAQVGQQVLVARTRPLSKTKHHVIIQILEEGKIEKIFGTEEQGKKLKQKKAPAKIKAEATDEEE